MKLLTLNSHSWFEENQLEKIEYIAKVIYEKAYDVIALQEVNQHMNEEVAYQNIRKDNFALLLQQELKKLGNNQYEFIWSQSHMAYDEYEEGVCLMTKLPISKKESFYISKSNSKTFWKSRKIVKVNVIYNNQEISFMSCHLGWWDDKEEPFEYQVKNLINKIDDEKLVFVMGDFNNNANLRSEGYDYLSNYLIDTYKLAKEKDDGITIEGEIAGWDENKQGLRIDIIFVNREVDVTQSKVIFNGENKSIVSDHYGVEVNINLENY